MYIFDKLYMLKDTEKYHTYNYNTFFFIFNEAYTSFLSINFVNSESVKFVFFTLLVTFFITKPYLVSSSGE